jgi:hypothetical protein
MIALSDNKQQSQQQKPNQMGTFNPNLQKNIQLKNKNAIKIKSSLRFCFFYHCVDGLFSRNVPLRTLFMIE